MNAGSVFIGAVAAAICVAHSHSFVFRAFAHPAEANRGLLLSLTSGERPRDSLGIGASASARRTPEKQRPDKDFHGVFGGESFTVAAHEIPHSDSKDTQNIETGETLQEVEDGKHVSLESDYPEAPDENGGVGRLLLLSMQDGREWTEHDRDLSLQREVARLEARRKRRVKVALASLGGIFGAALVTLGVLWMVQSYRNGKIGAELDTTRLGPFRLLFRGPKRII